MDQAIPWSRCCSGNPLSNEEILLPQYFDCLLFYGLNPLQLTQEKEKSSVDQGFTGCVNIFLSECIWPHLFYFSIVKSHFLSFYSANTARGHFFCTYPDALYPCTRRFHKKCLILFTILAPDSC